MIEAADSLVLDERINKDLGRLGIAFFFDQEGIVDEYFFFLLEEMSKFTVRNVFISNGPIRQSDDDRLVSMGFEIIIRDNVGFDVWAYKSAIEYVGYDNLGKYSEVILFNHTFYGPIYPFEEMFSKMDETACGFWGITAHKEMDPNPFTGKTGDGALPRHLNSHFIAVRRSMAMSDAFREYWQTMPMITSYNDSVLTHESRFTKHFQDIGYTCVVYDNDESYDSKYPCFINVDEAMENRCPILKRRIFFHDPVMHELNAIDLPRALRIMRETSDYDEKMIWPNAIRTADLRTLNTVAGLTSVFPDVRSKPEHRSDIKSIAVCLHVYYVDMVGELLALADTIDQTVDLIITTDTEAKATQIEEICTAWGKAGKVIVRIMEVNRGRDMAALFITCKDLFLSDDYDLVLRLHSKKSPQVDSSRSNLFKRHMFDNLANSKGYVANILDMFERKPWIGLAVPPAVHISYSTLGLGWFANKPRAEEIAKELDLKVKLDANTPVAAYGTMFWFRPKALRKLFERQWMYEDFNAEPNHVDGGLAHVIERLIAYTAQDAGYTTQQILCEHQAEYNYSMLEFKYAEISSNLRYNFPHQIWMMRQWQAAGNPLPAHNYRAKTREGFSFKAAWHEDDKILDRLPSDAGKQNIDAFWNGRVSWQRALDLENAATNITQRNSTFEDDIMVVVEFLSGVDSSHYLGMNESNVREKVGEYLLFGWATGKDIFVLFDTQFYLRHNPDVAGSHFNPFVHYIRHGRFEGRQPHPLFDPAHFARVRNMEISQDVDGVRSFLNAPVSDRTSPHVLFDMELYHDWYPDIAAHAQNALSHYIRHGAYERRQPHIIFDQHFYEEGVGTPIPSDINPLVHYLEIGAAAGIDPHPLFDGLHYAETAKGGLNGKPALMHYLTAPADQRGDAHPLFDWTWYARQWGVDDLPINPLEHYLKTSPNKKQTPHPLFDGPAYLRAYPEVESTGMDPLVHYVKYGVGENRQVPGFSKENVLDSPKKRGNGKIATFVHFLKYFYEK